MEDLRLIQVEKENLTGLPSLIPRQQRPVLPQEGPVPGELPPGLPSLIRSLAGRRQKFILFIDDLAFDQDDKTYQLKLATNCLATLGVRPAWRISQVMAWAWRASPDLR